MTHMTDFALGIFLFTTLAFTALCMLLVLFHMRTQRELMLTLRDMSEDMTDGFSKLMQTTLIHLQAANPQEAVSMQAALEREQAILAATASGLEQELEKSLEPIPGRVIGYKSGGKTFMFKTPPHPAFLRGIDPSQLIRAESGAQV